MRMLALAALLSVAPAQDPPQFETATVKPPGPKDRFIALFNYPGGRIQITNYSLEQLLEEALRVQPFQISGPPEWVGSERFMIEAKPPASSRLSTFTPSNREAPLVDEQRQMLLALLIDRFELKFHRESREGPVYLLVKGKNPKLNPTQHPDGRMFLAGMLGGPKGDVTAGNATMHFIASQLSSSLGRPVLDRTGLTGAFDFTLEHVYDPDERDLVAIAAPSTTLISSSKTRAPRSRQSSSITWKNHRQIDDAQRPRVPWSRSSRYPINPFSLSPASSRFCSMRAIRASCSFIRTRIGSISCACSFCTSA